MCLFTIEKHIQNKKMTAR